MKAIYILLISAAIAGTATAQSDYPTNALGNNTTAIGVSLSNLNARSQNNAVQISWNATAESNMSNHQIEKSTNGSDFSVLGTLTAQNIGTNYTYTYTDATPVQGMNYYRIRSTDKTGKATLSNILTFNNSIRRTDLAVIPNPVRNGVLNMQLSNFSGGRYFISLYGSGGQRAFTQTMTLSEGTTTETVFLPRTLSSGTYFLQVSNGQENFSKQVLLQ